MDYVVETKEVGRFTVKIHADSHMDLQDAVCDEPVAIYGDRGFEILDQTKTNLPTYGVLRAIESGCAESAMDEMSGYYLEWEWQNGKVRVENSDWYRPRYYKTAESACAAMFEYEHGFPMSDMRVEQFGDYRSTFLLVFLQSELDAYAGGKNAISCRDTCQNIVDGEVYGFDILDANGDSVESCWGFIGDADYCLKEAVAVAESLENDAVESDAIAFAATVEATRPDMYQGAVA